jgi:hypothetical protein
MARAIDIFDTTWKGLVQHSSSILLFATQVLGTTTIHLVKITTTCQAHNTVHSTQSLPILVGPYLLSVYDPQGLGLGLALVIASF